MKLIIGLKSLEQPLGLLNWGGFFYNQFAGEKTHGFNHVDESPLFFILTVDIYLTYIYKCGTIYL